MFSRRQLLALGLASPAYSAALPGETHMATGVKTGELTPRSATLWLRRTASSLRLNNGIVRRGHQSQAVFLEPGLSPDLLEGAAPGAPGYFQVRYQSGARRRSSRLLEVDPTADFTAQLLLDGLQPATSYSFLLETRATRNGRVDGELTGRFRTLPLATSPTPAHIALLSCQMYCHMDSPDGFALYRSIERDQPNFLLSCGDNVYYDNESPIARSAPVALHHWQRMYSLPSLHSCLRHTPGFWQKDDHDTLSDDAWPSMPPGRMAPLTFAEGQKIFRDMVPAPPPARPLYRSIRVGRHLELFLTESRDYRSPNTDPDSPAKTIWGDEQKNWLFSALRSSDATFKILVNPNPLVGPDRKSKKDNHANASFASEGAAIRRFLRDNFPHNLIAVCGDRHWQYHSVHPDTGLHEFGCGAASDAHAGGTPGLDPAYHRFHRVLGGYLTIEVDTSSPQPLLQFTHKNVEGNPVHRHRFPGRPQA